MQSYQLTVDKFLDHAARWASAREVVTARAGASSLRIGYADLRNRANRASGALLTLGMCPGDRIATLAWNTQHHFELYYAAMGVGLVCHTLNPRLTVEQLAAMINEAADRILAAPANLAPLVEALLQCCPTLEHLLWIDGDPPAPKMAAVREWEFEHLLATLGRGTPWAAIAETAPAGLCYTSGTTGRPKGVLYTHRSNYLHTVRALQADAFAITARNSLLIAVPMFHANGWGLPFAAPAAGAKVVLPGRQADGASLSQLMRDEEVTIAVGVQTVWLGVVEHLERTGATIPALERVIVGGSDCPEGLVRRLEKGLGARVQTSWGMTELSPLGVTAPPGSEPDPSAGRLLMGLDVKLTDADGVALPRQHGVVGHLKVKGPSVVDRYFGMAEDALDEEGFFDTGDLASIDAAGNLTIRGRSKDLIKSGGEWINPAEIEAIIGREPMVDQVAVIARADGKWGERPVLVVEPRPGATLRDEDLFAALRGKIADWWMPDAIVRVDAMPLAATGKIDKPGLRAAYAAGTL